MKSKYEALKKLREIVSEFSVYLQEGVVLTRIDENDIVLDEDDEIIIKNWSE